MIDFIKYFPLKLRQPDQNEAIRGPYFSSLKDITLKVSGNTLRFQTPRHQPKYDYIPVCVKSRDGIESPFRLINGSANKTWISAIIFGRAYSFWYQWFGGHKGDLNFDISIIKRHDKHVFNGFSLLHPRGFEYAITNYLNTLYGFKDSLGKATYQAPINWRTHSNLPVFSASFDIKPSNESLLYVFPISHRHFVKMEFAYIGIGDKLRQQMEALANRIIDSVTLELGPETQSQWDEISAQCADMSLCEEFPPLKWPIKREEIENVSTINLEPPAPEIFA